MKRLLLFIFLFSSSIFAQDAVYEWFMGDTWLKETADHIKRVEADGGVVADKATLNMIYTICKRDNTYTLGQFGGDPNYGGQKRDVNGFGSKLYNMFYKESANLLTGDNSTFTSGAGNWVGFNGSVAHETDHAKTTLTASGNSGMRLSYTWTVGKKYFVSAKVKLQSGSAVEFIMGDGAGPTSTIKFTPTSVLNTFSGYFTCASNTSYLYIYSALSNGSVYEIDDVVLKEVLNPDLEQGTAASQPLNFPYYTDNPSSYSNVNLLSGYDFTNWDNRLNTSSKSGNTFVTSNAGGVQKLLLTVGKKYKVSFEVSTTASGYGVLQHDGVSSSAVIGSVNGTYEFTALYTYLYIRNSSAGTTTVTRLELYEAIPEPNRNVWAYDGATSNGDFIKSSLASSWNYPSTMIMALRQRSWTDNDYIWDGYNAFGLGLRQEAVSPRIRQYAGAWGTSQTDLPVNSFGVVHALYNNTNSFIQVNKNAALTGTVGTNNAQGLIIGAVGGGAAQCANIEHGSIFLFGGTLNSTQYDNLYKFIRGYYK